MMHTDSSGFMTIHNESASSFIHWFFFFGKKKKICDKKNPSVSVFYPRSSVDVYICDIILSSLIMSWYWCHCDKLFVDVNINQSARIRTWRRHNLGPNIVTSRVRRPDQSVRLMLILQLCWCITYYFVEPWMLSMRSSSLSKCFVSGISYKWISDSTDISRSICQLGKCVAWRPDQLTGKHSVLES